MKGKSLGVLPSAPMEFLLVQLHRPTACLMMTKTTQVLSYLLNYTLYTVHTVHSTHVTNYDSVKEIGLLYTVHLAVGLSGALNKPTLFNEYQVGRRD